LLQASSPEIFVDIVRGKIEVWLAEIAAHSQNAVAHQPGAGHYYSQHFLLGQLRK